MMEWDDKNLLYPIRGEIRELRRKMEREDLTYKYLKESLDSISRRLDDCHIPEHLHQLIKQHAKEKRSGKEE